MGTNYYWHPKPNPCPTCGHDPTEPIHIGKSSFGWTFSFHGTTEDENRYEGLPLIRSYKDWLHIFERPGVIMDEYGDECSIEDFKALVEKKSNAEHNHTKYCELTHPSLGIRNWLDEEGHSFSEGEFS